jgi:hypothetical protein
MVARPPRADAGPRRADLVLGVICHEHRASLQMGAEQSGGPGAIPGDVHDVAVMVTVTAPVGCDGLAGHQACLLRR